MWCEMQTQTRTAQQQLEAASRPWIKITEAKPWGDGPVIPALNFKQSPIGAATIAASLHFLLGMKNVGHSVAEVALRSELYIPAWQDFGQALPEEKKRFCSSPYGSAKEWYPSVMLFPDEPPYQWGQEAGHVVESSSGIRIDNQQVVALALIVCVNYRIRPTPKKYQTSAVYDVIRKGGGPRFFQLNIGTPADQLWLERNTTYDDAY